MGLRRYREASRLECHRFQSGQRLPCMLCGWGMSRHRWRNSMPLYGPESLQVSKITVDQSSTINLLAASWQYASEHGRTPSLHPGNCFGRRYGIFRPSRLHQLSKTTVLDNLERPFALGYPTDDLRPVIHI